MQAIKRSKGWIFGFSLLAGIILLLPFAPKTTYADTNTITWDSSVLSTFNQDDTEQSSQGITFNRPESAYISQSRLYLKGYTSFSSTIGDIKEIVISKSDMGYYSLTRYHEWKYENNTFTWNGTPTDNVTFSYSGEGFIPLDSIVFTIESPHAHDSLVKTDAVPATCTEDGTEAYWTCSECHKMFSDAEGKNEISNPITIPAKHSLVKTDAVAATCTEDGTEAYWTCSVCNKIFSDSEGINEISNPITIEARHKLVKFDKHEATCYEDGQEAFWACLECHSIFSDGEGKNEISNPITISATGHNWDKGTVTKAATTASTGVKTFTCTRCGDTKTEVIPKLKEETKPSGNVSTAKKANTLKVKVAKKTFKRSSLKKAKSFKIGATKAQGRVTYTLDKKTKKAKIKVSSGGKVTIPKKCKKGTYKITVKAAGNSKYKAGTKTVKIIIK